MFPNFVLCTVYHVSTALDKIKETRLIFPKCVLLGTDCTVIFELYLMLPNV